MKRRSLGSLGALVRKKRGRAKLRETAQEIGIGAATLLRVESGRIPDVPTFGKICKWLEIDPGSFLGFQENQQSEKFISVHFKAERTQNEDTINALAQMISYAMKSQKSREGIEGTDDA